MGASDETETKTQGSSAPLALSAALESESLRQAFPDHASAILEQYKRFHPFSDGHWLRVAPTNASDDAAQDSDAASAKAGVGSWNTMDVLVPAEASAPVRIVLPDGFEVRVREIGAHGKTLPAESAVAYRRAGGTSFWTAASGGVEEWLHLLPDVVTSEEPVAAWDVDGGVLRLREDGRSAVVLDERGVARIWVTAPRAFAASGRPVGVRLAVDGGKLLLSVDADHEEVLIDPFWSAASPMSAPRWAAASAALQDGRVFVVGGINSVSYLNTAEVYDPATNTWSAASFLLGDRAWHSATVLSDGKVLVTGGHNGSSALATASIYDPSNNSWSNGGVMNSTRVMHTAALLPDGKVLVAGGADNSVNVLSSAEIFDPATTTWTPVSPMLSTRENHTAVSLPNGKVLVAGGVDSAATYLASAELYDPMTGTWSSAGSMAVAREDHRMTLLNNGKVLVTGGTDGGSLNNTDLYTIATNTWAAGPPMGTARDVHVAIALGSGNVLVAGSLSAFNVSASAEVYNPTMNVWTAAPPMMTPRYYHGGALLGNGKAIVFGGADSASYLSSAELFSSGMPGDGCATALDCGNGLSCTDGVCCNTACGGGANDCMVCNAPGSIGTCSMVSAGTVCRAPAGPCDLPEACSGADALCPADTFAAVGTECRAAAGACDVVEGCLGSSAECPPDQPQPDGTSCNDGNACSLVDSCMAGQCVAGTPVDCSAKDPCQNAGACEPLTGMCAAAPSKPNGTECPGGTCQEGVCKPAGAGGGGGSSGEGGAGTGGGDPGSEGGCGCRTVGSDSNSQGALLLAGLFAAVMRARRHDRAFSSRRLSAMA